MMKMVVMLGNPGIQYKNTRHNAGFMFCSSVLPEAGWQTKFSGSFIKTGNTVFLRPMTFMNESGVSVRKAADFFNVDSCNILVVHDDIEQEACSVKLQRGGGMAGHNGLRSVKQHLGTDDFYRLRIGVGRPAHGDVASYVLDRFTELEQKMLEDTFAKASDLMNVWIRG